MSHPLDEVQYTPWGRRVDDDINLLKSQIRELDGHVGALHLELKANTVKTDSVKSDTQWLVDMFRGSRAFSKFLIGLAVILGALASVGIWLGWTAHK
jgi:hypothetical protein